MPNRESLIEKIRALMAKTVKNGCTEQEMDAALTKARAMIDAYEVTDAELRLTKQEKATLRKEPPGTADPHGIKAKLSPAISDFTDTKCWREVRNGKGAICFLGLRSDVQFATWLLDNLTQFVQAELVRYLVEEAGLFFGNQRERAIDGFVIGCTSRISKRLRDLVDQSKVSMTSSGKELVVVKNQLVTEAMAKLGIELKKRRTQRFRVARDAFDAGQAAGDRASFGRPVDGQNKTLRIGAAQ